MTERHPDDATLLTLQQDAATGVDYIATGRSPYYLEFRRMLHRLLRATERANDLRVYQDGDLSIGVRPGRARFGAAAVDFAGSEGTAIDTQTTSHIWLDDAGEIQVSTEGLPTDRTTFIALAEVTTDANAITSITDLRGETLLGAPSLQSVGISAMADDVNRALDGISEDVDATALNFLCAGHLTDADGLHRHSQMFRDEDSEAYFRLINDSTGDDAGIALRFALPRHMPVDTRLLLNRANGFLQQQFLGTTYNLVGSVHCQLRFEGAINASQNNKLIGVVPVTGSITDVTLSLLSNIDSTDDDDGLTATVKVNGVTVTTTSPAITASDGVGFVSTAQGDGASAILKSDGTQDVLRGDVLTVDLVRTANGTVSGEATDAVVLVTIRVDQPE